MDFPSRVFGRSSDDYELYEEEARNERRSYHRRFRFPKEVIDEDIAASYQNGVLEVTLPIEGPATGGREIEVE